MSEDLPKDIQEEIAQARNELDVEDLDYDETLRVKRSIAKDIFRTDCGQRTLHVRGIGGLYCFRTCCCERQCGCFPGEMNNNVPSH